MRCSAVFVLAAAVSVSAAGLAGRQDIADYPTCALTCLATADFGSCSQTDYACLCKSQAFINSTTTCIEGACTGDDLTKAESLAQGACASAGVTLSAPAATQTAPSGSAAPSATPSQGSNGASSHGPGAFAALAVIGAAALAL